MRISDWSSDVCSSDLAGDRFAAGIEHFAARQGFQAAEREREIRAVVDAAIERDERRLVERFEQLRALAEQRSVAVRGVTVVQLDGRGQRALRQFKFLFDAMGSEACRDRVCQYV